MKALLVSAAAAALILAAPAAFADPPNDHQNDKHHGEHHGTAQSHSTGTTSSHTPPPTMAGPQPMSQMNGPSHESGRTKTRHENHGIVETTASPATTLNRTNDNDRRNRDNRKDNYRNDNNHNNNHNNNNNWQGNRGHSNAHRNFDRRNVTAQHHYRYRGRSWHWPSGHHYQRWTFGMTLPSIFWSNNYWIDDYYDYGLGAPPPGAVWVRYGNDAILIDRYSGEILEVVYGQFY